MVIPSGASHLGSLAGHVRSLQADGKRVVFVTANRPYASLAARFEQEGVDARRLFIIDAVSVADGSPPPARPDNALFLQSPTMLEMIAMRTEQVLAQDASGGHMVLDCMNALNLYNGTGLVAEFAHFLSNRLRSRGAAGDLVVLDNEEGVLLEEALAGFTDGRVVLEGGA